MVTDSAPNELKQTPLEASHIALGAKMVPFGGWLMPVQYTSILSEHAAVRGKAGIFDISHMGQIFASGPGAQAWLNRMLTNDVADLAVGQGQYTLMLNGNGGVIDDLIIYRTAELEFLLVVNASMIEEDDAWLTSHQPADVLLRNESGLWAGMAVQGPESGAAFSALFPDEELPPRNGVARFTIGDIQLIACRTGYTGEDGFELFCDAFHGGAFFTRFVEAGVQPCGLGARDTLRLEMGYPLNGNDLSPSRTPLEAGLGFFVDMEKGDFIGRGILAAQKEQGLTHKLAAIQYLEKGAPPRAHYPVVAEDGTVIGELASGALSPSLMAGIGMAYLPVAHTRLGTSVGIDVRGKICPAKVVRKPFYKPA